MLTLTGSSRDLNSSANVSMQELRTVTIRWSNLKRRHMQLFVIVTYQITYTKLHF